MIFHTNIASGWTALHNILDIATLITEDPDICDIIQGFKLYHVTDRSFLPQIMEDGLIPNRKNMIFLSFSGRSGKSYDKWINALSNRITDPIVLEFLPERLLPFYMRDFEKSNDSNSGITASWGSTYAGKLIKITSINDLELWLQILEDNGVTDFDPVNEYELLEVMINRIVPPSKINRILERDKQGDYYRI